MYATLALNVSEDLPYQKAKVHARKDFIAPHMTLFSQQSLEGLPAMQETVVLH